jgi:glutathione S-transferase
MPLVMLTFGPMIDSELSRFILWRYGLPYEEKRHIFGWASFLALLHSGNWRIPLIYGDGVKLTGPRAIVDHYDVFCDRSRILIPAQQPLRTKVEADWASFNGDLATYVAQVAYFHLFPHERMLIGTFVHSIPWIEAKLTPTLYPLLRAVFTWALQLGPASAGDALLQTRRIADEVDRRIADGRKFLWGDRPTLADLAFATALAPLLLPDGYKAPIPTYAEMPAELKQIIDSLRQRPCFGLVNRIYALQAVRSSAKL